MPRFRFPLSTEDAYQLIGAYYTAEVENRGIVCRYDKFTLDKIWELAETMTAVIPKMGILLTGKVGNGKTTLMRAFDGAARQLADWHRVNPTDFGYQHPADFGLEMYSTKSLVNMSINEPSRFDRIVNVPMLGLDELGEEPRNIQNYGNGSRPIVELIEKRYNDQRFTFITSNLDATEIKNHYGERVADRLREMVTIIQFRDQASYRK